MALYFHPTVTTALVHFMLNLVADLLEYAWSTACVLFRAFGLKKTQKTTNQQPDANFRQSY